jgi:hypothetical protein
MAEGNDSKLPKRIVRTITLTEDDLSLLDGIERIISKTGQRIKTDSKLIRAAINVAHSSLHDQPYDLMEVADKVVKEDGRTQSRFLAKMQEKA